MNKYLTTLFVSSLLWSITLSAEHRIAATIKPVSLLIQAVSDNTFTIDTMLSGQDPHMHHFTPAQAAALQRSSLVMTISGVELNDHLKKLGIPFKELGQKLPSHPWLSLNSLPALLDETAGELCALDDARCPLFRRRAKALGSELGSVLSSCRDTLRSQDLEKALIVSTHISWEDLAGALGFKNTAHLYSQRHASTLPGALRAVAGKAKVASRVVFVADRDTPDSLRNVFQNDYNAAIIELDESMSDSADFSEFFNAVCQALNDVFARK